MPAEVTSKLILAALALAAALVVAAAIILPSTLLYLTEKAIETGTTLPVTALPGRRVAWIITVGNRTVGFYSHAFVIHVASTQCNPLKPSELAGTGTTWTCCDGSTCNILHIPRVEVTGNNTVTITVSDIEAEARQPVPATSTIAVLWLNETNRLEMNGTHVADVGPGEVKIVLEKRKYGSRV